MALRELLEKDHVSFPFLPLWRKILILCCLGFSLLTGFMALDAKLTLYGSGSHHPSPTTGQVYEVSVMHGAIRYVTQKEQDHLNLWEEKMGSLVGICFLSIVFAWITYRDPEEQRAGPRVNLTRRSSRN